MYQRIVIKLGTSVLTGGSPHFDRAHMLELVRQCAALQRQGKDVIICSSGAMAAGRERLNFPQLPNTISNRQMLAAVGQSHLMLLWENLFDIYNIHVGQLLLTRADVEDRRRYLNARDALRALSEHRIIPIINENDAVATTEIKVGDNDNLSALVALLAEADLLLLLTDQEGLFTADPRTEPNARLLSTVESIDEKLYQLAGKSVSGLGVGGMITKIQAADTARRGGVEVVIARGWTRNVIRKVVAGDKIGTRFLAQDTPLDNRKRWIFAGPNPAGRIRVDDGASHALCRKHSSLLPSGITAIEGRFTRGDTVSLLDARGSEIARGISRYNSQDLDRIKGCQSEQIAERLGYMSSATVVHRNDLILV
ncbi:glutamate 5-kinase [candidate division KSB3 bacterium]|uniref:Glutamate 5-kinase n=1 Tax=candidate division KSB3 bacterium TaxID=2044937 RepID=A0A2G6E8W2_9BACT|nr:MAG: glutamate 5-kinase [candidate division KSB3 bacterium]